jgi:hypothetical protein
MINEYLLQKELKVLLEAGYFQKQSATKNLAGAVTTPKQNPPSLPVYV